MWDRYGDVRSPIDLYIIIMILFLEALCQTVENAIRVRKRAFIPSMTVGAAAGILEDLIQPLVHPASFQSGRPLLVDTGCQMHPRMELGLRIYSQIVHGSQGAHAQIHEDLQSLNKGPVR